MACIRDLIEQRAKNIVAYFVQKQITQMVMQRKCVALKSLVLKIESWCTDAVYKQRMRKIRLAMQIKVEYNMLIEFYSKIKNSDST